MTNQLTIALAALAISFTAPAAFAAGGHGGITDQTYYGGKFSSPRPAPRPFLPCVFYPVVGGEVMHSVPAGQSAQYWTRVKVARDCHAIQVGEDKTTTTEKEPPKCEYNRDRKGRKGGRN